MCVARPADGGVVSHGESEKPRRGRLGSVKEGDEIYQRHPQVEAMIENRQRRGYFEPFVDYRCLSLRPLGQQGTRRHSADDGKGSDIKLLQPSPLEH